MPGVEREVGGEVLRIGAVDEAARIAGVNAACDLAAGCEQGIVLLDRVVTAVLDPSHGFLGVDSLAERDRVETL